MKEGDVLLFIGGNDLVDNVERLETHSKFTHAALAVNESEFMNKLGMLLITKSLIMRGWLASFEK